MKQIVLKPKLKEGEEVIYNGRKQKVTLVDGDTVYFVDENNFSSKIFGFSDIYKIIESPDDPCDHVVADAGKVMVEKSKLDAVYNERAKILAAFAHHLNHEGKIVWIAQHPTDDKNWDDDWRTILVINLPHLTDSVPGSWQLTWHFHDSEKNLLDGLPILHDFKWDGHTTDEKYKKLLAYYLPNGIISTHESEEEKAKPPLKLRVGGVYKNRQGGIKKIVGYHLNTIFKNHPYKYIDENGMSYRENGDYSELENHCYDLIEEVQPEKLEKQVERFVDSIRAYQEHKKQEPTVNEKETVKYCDCQLNRNPVKLLHKADNKYYCHYCHKQWPFVADKSESNSSVVEYCECEKIRHWNGVCVMCNKTEKPSEYILSENELPKHDQSLKPPFPKPEVNPFKVGDQAFAYSISNLEEIISKGTVMRIENNILWLGFEAEHAWIAYHYKQCEKIS